MKTAKDDKKDEFDDKPYSTFDQQISRRITHFYISSHIVEPHQYAEMIQRIQTAGPEDFINIHLNTPGGHLDTGVQIINAMQSSAAHIIVSIEGNCHSLGTLIFLAADEFVVHDNCLMMFHTYSGITFGKGHEQESQLAAQTKWFNALARKLYIPFLTIKEVDRIMKGEDLWLQSEEIRKRLVAMVKTKNVKRKGGKKNIVDNEE